MNNQELPKQFYFTGEENINAFQYVTFPVLLLKDDIFKDLSDSAKILYALLLGRLSLSVKNDWKDEERRTYIIYSVTDVMQDMNISHATASRLFSELSCFGSGKIGLIRKERVQNCPSRIYVLNFLEVYKHLKESQQNEENEVSQVETEKPDLQPVVSDLRRRTSQNCDDGRLRFETTDNSQMRQRTSQNCDDNNYLNNSYLDKNHSISHAPKDTDFDGWTDGDREDKILDFDLPYGTRPMKLEEIKEQFTENEYVEMITYNLFCNEKGKYKYTMEEARNRIYELLTLRYKFDDVVKDYAIKPDILKSLIDIIADVIASGSSTRIGKTEYDADYLGKRFFKLQDMDIVTVIIKVQEASSKKRITDIKKYYLTCLLSVRETSRLEKELLENYTKSGAAAKEKDREYSDKILDELEQLFLLDINGSTG